MQTSLAAPVKVVDEVVRALLCLTLDGFQIVFERLRVSLECLDHESMGRAIPQYLS